MLTLVHRAAPAGAIELWMLHTSEVDPGRLELSILDSAERARALRLARPRDRLRFLATHVLLRKLLGERLGSAPAALRFGRERCPHCGAPRGRPAVADPPRPIHFSLSYSEDLALIAIAPAPVGVDIQSFPARRTVRSVTALLGAAERGRVSGAAPEQRAATFARLWAREEAYLKGRGTGIAHGTSAATQDRPREAGPSFPGWAVADVPAPKGYRAAVALATTGGGTLSAQDASAAAGEGDPLRAIATRRS